MQIFVEASISGAISESNFLGEISDFKGTPNSQRQV